MKKETRVVIENLKIRLSESYRQECNLLQENKELRRKTFRTFNDDECWCWCDDGENYLDSLVCPIVISVGDLEAYVQQRIAEVRLI